MSILTLLMCSASLLPQGGSSAPVVINEFVYKDGPSVDDLEMVELYNRSGQPVDISGWALETEASTIQDWSIPQGTVLPPGGFYVLGAELVPDPKQAITRFWAGGQPYNMFPDRSAALILRDEVSRTIDVVHYETQSGIRSFETPEGQGIWGGNLTSDVFPHSWQRAVDGLDTDNNGDDFVVLPWTPGRSNAPSGTWPYAANYDRAALEVFVAEWGHTVGGAYVIKPTQVSTHNPNAIPPSPQGGAAIAFTPVSGANPGQANMLLATVPSQAVFEAWVYFDAEAELSGHETWSIGFGATGSSFQPPDPDGWLGTTRNGNQGGVSWTYQVTQNGAWLYLIDHNDGGWGTMAATPQRVLGRVQIVPGQNDGWQKLRLERSGVMVMGSFGGALGCADGSTFWGETSHGNPTTLYIGYRESIPNNDLARPPTLDDVLIKDTASAVKVFGTAVPTNSGTPRITAMGLPTVGHAGWGLELSGLVPSQAALLLLGATRPATPFDMSLLGGQPGSFLEVSPLLSIPVLTDPQGSSNTPLPIPCRLVWPGTSLYWQVFDPDPTLGLPLPFGNSAGLETTIGI